MSCVDKKDANRISASKSGRNPAQRIRPESEEIPTRVQFSPQGGNGTVVGISELVRVWGLEPLLKILKTIENKGLYFVCV